MEIPAYILINEENYSLEKLLSDTIVAAFHADLMLYFNNENSCKDRDRKYKTIDIIENTKGIEKNKRFRLYVASKENVDLFKSYKELGIDPNRKLVQVWMEELQDHGDVVFLFMYEYLKLNSEDLFWVNDSNWVYQWQDMQKLGFLQNDPYWYHTDPKTID